MLLFANFETSFAYFETHLHILKLKNIRILIIKNKGRDSLGNPGNVMILDIGVSPVAFTWAGTRSCAPNRLNRIPAGCRC